MNKGRGDLQDGKLPYVSVIVPFHNAQEYLGKLILSLINQNYPHDSFEIILIDDGSTDNSSSLIKEIINNTTTLKDEYNIRLLSLKKKSGPAVARNQGILMAKGEIIAFTDADCVADSNWLKFLVIAFLNRKEIGGVYGKIVTDNRTRIFPLEVVPVGHKYVTCNIAFRKEALLTVGLFDEKFKSPFREDTDLALRAIKSGFQIAYEPKAIIYHPIKKWSLSNLIKKTFEHQYDNLLYLKHSKLAINNMGTSLVTKPVVGPLSPLGLTCITFFVSLIVLLGVESFIHLFILLSSLSLIVMFSFILYGYKLTVTPKKAIPISLRIKTFIAVVLYLIVLAIARFYGSLKFRKFLL